MPKLGQLFTQARSNLNCTVIQKW